MPSRPELKTPHELLSYFLALDKREERIRERRRQREERLRADFEAKMAEIAADEARELEANLAEKREFTPAVFGLVGPHPQGVGVGTQVLRVTPDGLLEYSDAPVDSLGLVFVAKETAAEAE